MPKLILFDIDGTLVLTGGAGLRGMIRAFEQVFAKPAEFDGIPVAGRTDQIILRDMLTKMGLRFDDGAIERFRDVYCSLLPEEIDRGGPQKGIMPGVRELLDELQARDDMVLGLLTGNFAEAARLKLEYFDLWRYFRCGAYGDDAIERNELVAIAVARARRCGAPEVTPQQIIVVGDTPLDVACAMASRARCLAVATGGYDVASLEATGADAVLADLSDTRTVLDLLDAL